MIFKKISNPNYIMYKVKQNITNDNKMIIKKRILRFFSTFFDKKNWGMRKHHIDNITLKMVLKKNETLNVDISFLYK